MALARAVENACAPPGVPEHDAEVVRRYLPSLRGAVVRGWPTAPLVDLCELSQGQDVAVRVFEPCDEIRLSRHECGSRGGSFVR